MHIGFNKSYQGVGNMATFDSDKIKEIDSRLRKVEDAILEISLVAKYAKYGLIVLGISLGVDVSYMV